MADTPAPEALTLDVMAGRLRACLASAAIYYSLATAKDWIGYTLTGLPPGPARDTALADILARRTPGAALGGWILAADKLPPNKTRVLIVDDDRRHEDDGPVVIAQFDGRDWNDDKGLSCRPSLWTPLPDEGSRLAATPSPARSDRPEATAKESVCTMFPRAYHRSTRHGPGWEISSGTYEVTVGEGKSADAAWANARDRVLRGEYDGCSMTALATPPTPPAPDGLAEAVRSYLAAVDALAKIDEVRSDQGMVDYDNECERLADLIGARRVTLDAALSDQPTPPVGVGVEQLRALSEAAQRGPWYTNGNQPQILGEETEDDQTLFYTVARAPQGARLHIDRWRQWEADKAFIVAAANFIRARLSSTPTPDAAPTPAPEGVGLRLCHGQITAVEWARDQAACLREQINASRYPAEKTLIGPVGMEMWKCGFGTAADYLAVLDRLARLDSQADKVDALRPGLEEALRIVEAKRQTVPTASSVHDACVSLISLFNARLAATPDLNGKVDG